MIWSSFKVNTVAHFLTVKEFLPAWCGTTMAMLSRWLAWLVLSLVDYACTKASALAFHDGLSQEIQHWYGATKIRTRYGNVSASSPRNQTRLTTVPLIHYGFEHLLSGISQMPVILSISRLWTRR